MTIGNSTLLNGVGSAASPYSASKVSPKEAEETRPSSSPAVERPNRDTYTPSEEAIAFMSASEESSDAVGDSEDAVVDGDVSVDDTVVDGSTSDDVVENDSTVDTDVEVEDSEEVVPEEDVEVEEEAEEEESVEDPLDSLSQSYSDYDWNEVKLSTLSNQWNTMSSMLNALSNTTSENLQSVASESWVNDASTFNYAGRYLAKSAAGTHGIQQQQAAAAETTTEKSEIEYNDFSMTGSSSSDSEETE